MTASAVFLSLMNRPYTISRRDRTHDGQGGHAIAYVTLATVNGRLRPASSAERLAAMQQQAQISHVLYVPEGTDIARGDMVEGADITVDVLAVREPSRADHHLECDCRERQIEAVAELGS